MAQVKIAEKSAPAALLLKTAALGNCARSEKNTCSVLNFHRDGQGKDLLFQVNVLKKRYL